MYKAKRDYTDEVYSPIFPPFIVLIERLKVSIGTFLTAKVAILLCKCKCLHNKAVGMTAID